MSKEWNDDKRKQVISILSLAIFVSMIGNGLVNPLITLYSEDLGGTGIWLGVVFSSFAISRALITPFIGRLSDKHERRAFLIFGMLSYTVISFLYLLPNTIGPLVFVRLLHGAASGFIAPVVMAYGSDISADKNRGQTLGTITASRFFGFGIGPVVGGALGAFFGFQAAFIGMAIMGFIALLVIIILLPKNKSKQTAQIKRTNYRALLTHRALMSMVLFRLFMAFGMAFIVAFLPLLGVSLGMNILQMGFIITLIAISASLFQYLAGRWADRFDKITLIMSGSLVIGISLILMGRSTSMWQFAGSGLLLAMATALTIPATAAVTSSIGTHVGHGSAMGMWNFGQDAGVGGGPLVAGFVLTLVGYPVLFAVMGALAFGGMLIAFVLFLSDPKRKDYV